jgi:hypothetical protein
MAGGSMKSIFIIILSVLFLAVPFVGASNSANVKQLHLSRADNEIMLRIDVTGTFQYSHQIAEAVEGKPFRVLVDVFPAVHDLDKKDYLTVPSTLVKSIRTSQYSVNPDKIVRVVIDLERTAVYRIDRKGNYIYVYLPDKGGEDFHSWHSSAVKSSQTVAVKDLPEVKPEPVEQEAPEVAVEIQPDPEPVDQPEKEEIYESVVIETPVPATEELAQAWKKVSIPHYPRRSSSDFDRELAIVNESWAANQVSKPAASDPLVEPEEISSEVSEEIAVVEIEKPPEPVVVKEVKEDLEPSTMSTPAVTEKPEQQPQSEEPVVAKTLVKDQPETKDVATADAKDDEVVSAGVKTEEPDSEQSKPTSRFRRQPAFPAKLKGTIVAEFPTRMVIQYSPGSRRDPFETLINETKKSNNPTGKKIPDVETSRLVGVLESANGEKRALLEDLDGYGYILKTGDKVKKGYVGKIISNKAYFRLFEYGWSRTVALLLTPN